MTARPCAICGAGVAPFGFRRSGPLSKLPEGKRGALWACAKPDCQLAAFNRREVAERRPALTMAQAFARRCLTFPAGYVPPDDPAAVPAPRPKIAGPARKGGPPPEAISDLFGK